MLWKWFRRVSAGPSNYSFCDVDNALSSAGCFPHPRSSKMRSTSTALCESKRAPRQSTWASSLALACPCHAHAHETCSCTSPSSGYLPSTVVFSLWPITCSYSFPEETVCLSPWCLPTAGNVTEALWVLLLKQALQVWERRSTLTPSLTTGKGLEQTLEKLFTKKTPSLFLSIFLNILYFQADGRPQESWNQILIMSLEDSPKTVCLMLCEIYHCYYVPVPQTELRS